MSPRLRLVLAAALFIGWLSYLSFAALTKNRGPIISRAQYAAARIAVVADVEVGPDGAPTGKAKVVEALTGDSPAAGTTLFVTNLPAAQGFDGPGEYLLLLVESNGPPPVPHAPFTLVGQQRSPGSDLAGVGKPFIYRWTESVKKQLEKLPKPGEPHG